MNILATTEQLDVLADNGAVAAVKPWLAGGISATNCKAAYIPKGALNYATSKINLNDPGTNDAFEGIAVDWAAPTGWSPDGVTQYLRTNLIPGDAWSMVIGYSNLPTSGGGYTLAGMYRDIGGNASFLLQEYLNQMYGYHGNGSNAAFNVPALASGVYAIAGKSLYRNGVLELTSIGAGTGINYSEMYIGALSYNGSALQFTPFTIKALWIYDITLDAAQNAALAATMAAL